MRSAVSRPRPRRRAALAALALATLAGGACAPRSAPLHGSPHADSARVGGVSVTEVFAGRPAAPFRFVARPGGLLYVFFGYAHCPDVCPTTLSDLRRALHRLGPDSARVEVAFVTVDTGRDSASVLVPFVTSFVPGAHALRPASQEELAAAERAFGATSDVTRQPDGSIAVSHTGAAYVVDAAGRVLVEWDFGIRPDAMAADLATLLPLQGAAR